MQWRTAERRGARKWDGLLTDSSSNRDSQLKSSDCLTSPPLSRRLLVFSVQSSQLLILYSHALASDLISPHTGLRDHHTPQPVGTSLWSSMWECHRASAWSRYLPMMSWQPCKSSSSSSSSTRLCHRWLYVLIIMWTHDAHSLQPGRGDDGAELTSELPVLLWIWTILKYHWAWVCKEAKWLFVQIQLKSWFSIEKLQTQDTNTTGLWDLCFLGGNSDQSEPEVTTSVVLPPAIHGQSNLCEWVFGRLNEDSTWRAAPGP